VAVFTLLIPRLDVCVWVLGSRSHCTHLSVIKCDCEPLSRSALHGMY
jgi:hypothetical protein